MSRWSTNGNSGWCRTSSNWLALHEGYKKFEQIHRVLINRKPTDETHIVVILRVQIGCNSLLNTFTYANRRLQSNFWSSDSRHPLHYSFFPNWKKKKEIDEQSYWTRWTRSSRHPCSDVDCDERVRNLSREEVIDVFYWLRLIICDVCCQTLSIMLSSAAFFFVTNSPLSSTHRQPLSVPSITPWTINSAQSPGLNASILVQKGRFFIGRVRTRRVWMSHCYFLIVHRNVEWPDRRKRRSDSLQQRDKNCVPMPYIPNRLSRDWNEHRLRRRERFHRMETIEVDGVLTWTTLDHSNAERVYCRYSLLSAFDQPWSKCFESRCDDQRQGSVVPSC